MKVKSYGFLPIVPKLKYGNVTGYPAAFCLFHPLYSAMNYTYLSTVPAV